MNARENFMKEFTLAVSTTQENYEVIEGQTQYDVITAEFIARIEAIKIHANGKSLLTISKENIFGDYFGFHIFTDKEETDRNVYVGSDGSLIEAPFTVKAKADLEVRTAKELVTKYGPQKCLDGLTNAIRRIKTREENAKKFNEIGPRWHELKPHG